MSGGLAGAGAQDGGLPKPIGPAATRDHRVGRSEGKSGPVSGASDRSKRWPRLAPSPRPRGVVDRPPAGRDLRLIGLRGLGLSRVGSEETGYAPNFLSGDRASVPLRPVRANAAAGRSAHGRALRRFVVADKKRPRPREKATNAASIAIARCRGATPSDGGIRDISEGPKENGKSRHDTAGFMACLDVVFRVAPQPTVAPDES